MAMLSINGRDMPAPSAMKVSIFDVTSAAERNAAGQAVMDRVAEKRCLELMWSRMTGDELAFLLENVSGGFFEASYPDPQTGAFRTMNCFCGDRTTGVLRMQDGSPVWTNVEMRWTEK